MDRLLVHLEPAELNSIARISADGSLDIDTGAVAKVVGRSLDLAGVRVAVDSADYLQHEDGTRSRTPGWSAAFGGTRGVMTPR